MAVRVRELVPYRDIGIDCNPKEKGSANIAFNGH